MIAQESVHLALIAIPAVLVFACIRLLRRFGWISTVVLLIGSLAFLIDQIVSFALAFVLLPYVAAHPNGVIKRTLWPTCTQHPAFVHAHDILTAVGWISLFVGFVWFCFRSTRTPNQAMQPTASRRTASLSDD